MGKELWKPGNMVYPLPAVMVSCADKEGHDNIITIAWTGTICTNPAMLYISVRPTRYSYHLIRESGEFVVNLTTKDLVKATDWCGVRSGRDVDKWSEMHLTRGNAQTLIYAPIIEESSHHMFHAKVTGVQVDDRFMQDNGKFALNKTGLLAYSHGEYFDLGKSLGTFGYSVKKKKKVKKKK